MSQELVIIGAGGFGREVVDVVEAINTSQDSALWTIRGLVDDDPTPDNLDRLEARRVPYLGKVDDLVGDRARPLYCIGIGNPPVRRRIAERLDAAGFAAATLLHPTVTTGAHVTIGPGSVLCAGVRVTTNIRIGRHVHLNLNSTVGHDTTIGDFVSVNPLASISGDCTIEAEVTMGVGSSVINALTIGERATVGGGACVVRPVQPEKTVIGIPARPIAENG